MQIIEDSSGSYHIGLPGVESEAEHIFVPITATPFFKWYSQVDIILRLRYNLDTAFRAFPLASCSCHSSSFSLIENISLGFHTVCTFS